MHVLKGRSTLLTDPWAAAIKWKQQIIWRNSVPFEQIETGFISVGSRIAGEIERYRSNVAKKKKRRKTYSLEIWPLRSHYATVFRRHTKVSVFSQSATLWCRGAYNFPCTQTKCLIWDSERVYRIRVNKSSTLSPLVVVVVDNINVTMEVVSYVVVAWDETRRRKLRAHKCHWKSRKIHTYTVCLCVHFSCPRRGRKNNSEIIILIIMRDMK